MKVVFLEDVPGTAKIGDVKDVKPGFARNYLLPRRLAMTATPSIIKTVEMRAAREARLQDARDNEARAVAARLEGVSYTMNARAGSTGKLFGSVGTNDIAAKVGETLSREFDRHDVVLADPIKELGDYQIAIRLSKNVQATVSVSVIGEDGTTMADIKAKASGGAATAEAPTGADAEAVSDDESATDAGPADDAAETTADEVTAEGE